VQCTWTGASVLYGPCFLKFQIYYDTVSECLINVYILLYYQGHTHPLLVPRSWKGRAIPLSILWACNRTALPFTKWAVDLHVQGDQKVSVHLMIMTQEVTSNVQSVPSQSPDIYWHDVLCSWRPCSVYRCPHSKRILWCPSSNH
jgi:hypothetical protein